MLPPSALLIGLDIGASKTLAGLITRSGEIVRVKKIATAAAPSAILADARALCADLLATATAPVLGIGVGSAGIVDTRAKTVIYANDNLPGWASAQLTDLAPAGLPLVAANDARAMAYGEATLGAGADYDSLLCLTVGTGIGGAIIIEGEIWPGAHFSAGEIGYLVVGWADEEPLLLDQYVSGPAIERAYQKLSGEQKQRPLPEISCRAAQGEAIARAAIEGKARQLGIILAGIAAAINPEAVIIGGGVPQIGALWWQPFAAAFYAAVPPPLRATPLLPAALGVEAVMLGAAMLAWQEVKL